MKQNKNNFFIYGIIAIALFLVLSNARPSFLSSSPSSSTFFDESLSSFEDVPGEIIETPVTGMFGGPKASKTEPCFNCWNDEKGNYATRCVGGKDEILACDAKCPAPPNPPHEWTWGGPKPCNKGCFTRTDTKGDPADKCGESLDGGDCPNGFTGECSNGNGATLNCETVKGKKQLVSKSCPPGGTCVHGRGDKKAVCVARGAPL